MVRLLRNERKKKYLLKEAGLQKPENESGFWSPVFCIKEIKI